MRNTFPDIYFSCGLGRRPSPLTDAPPSTHNISGGPQSFGYSDQQKTFSNPGSDLPKHDTHSDATVTLVYHFITFLIEKQPKSARIAAITEHFALNPCDDSFSGLLRGYPVRLSLPMPIWAVDAAPAAWIRDRL